MSLITTIHNQAADIANVLSSKMDAHWEETKLQELLQGFKNSGFEVHIEDKMDVITKEMARISVISKARELFTIGVQSKTGFDYATAESKWVGTKIVQRASEEETSAADVLLRAGHWITKHEEKFRLHDNMPQSQKVLEGFLRTVGLGFFLE
jgi:hypothetical protein